MPAIGRRSLITFAALVLLLLVPWPGAGRVFGVAFSAYANGVVRVLGIGSASRPRFTPAPTAPREEGGEWAVGLSFRGPDDRDGPKMPLDTRLLGYTPLAVFLALGLASAVSTRRKLVILGVGTGILLVRLAVAIALPVARASGSLSSGSPLGPIAEVVWWAFIDQPAMSYAAPLLAWWIGLSATTARSRLESDRGRTKMGAAWATPSTRFTRSPSSRTSR